MAIRLDIVMKLWMSIVAPPDGNGTRQVAYFTGKTKGLDDSYTQQMKDKIDSDKGRAIYSKRIGTVAPVFANIRHALGLDRFTLRGKT